MRHLFHLCACLLLSLTAQAQTQTFDLSRQSKADKPFSFSVAVPDGNYRVTVELGSKSHEGNTMVRAESRRLFVENTPTKRGKFKTFSFVVNKRSPYITLSRLGRQSQLGVHRPAPCRAARDNNA